MASSDKDPFDKRRTGEILMMMQKGILQIEQAMQVVRLLDPDKTDLPQLVRYVRAALGTSLAEQKAMIVTLQVWIKERDTNAEFNVAVATDIMKLNKEVDKLWSAVNK